MRRHFPEDADRGWTHAIHIDAPPEEVWPWVAQIGAGTRTTARAEVG